jgi:hypothetical protein
MLYIRRIGPPHQRHLNGESSVAEQGLDLRWLKKPDI